MPTYSAPVKDMQYLIEHVWDYQDLLSQCEALADYTPDLIEAVLTEAAKFNEQVLFPLNQIGDKQGCQLQDGKVLTPKGFKEAYQQYVEAGWGATNGSLAYGGQGLPHMLTMCVDEMLSSSNISFHLYPNLTQGVARAIEAHASEALKQRYLPKMISGEWTGAMCLTESHCGTDLGLIRTKANQEEDGTYRLSGSKIFITNGLHDLTDNMIHLVLARTEEAPAGVRGLSLFLVPVNQVSLSGEVGESNGVSCGALEDKMGLKGSATCVVNYDEAKGWLVGELGKGLAGMFTVMNIERLAIGLQGLGQAEVSYQNALAYAHERRQGRAPNGAAEPNEAADKLIVHPDVKRMLQEMQCFTEGARALSVYVAKWVDLSHHANEQSTRDEAEGLVALFTPIVKAFFTDYGTLMCNQGLQVFGGHGYIKEWGMEQLVRDVRIAQLYEGANGIQALDLIKRKILADKGRVLGRFLKEVESACDADSSVTPILVNNLTSAVGQLREALAHIEQQVQSDEGYAGFVSVKLLEAIGLIALGYMWLKMATVSAAKGLTHRVEKVANAEFYATQLLTKCQGLFCAILQTAA